MLKTLLGFFGMGKIPNQERTRLEAEGIVLIQEGVSGSVRFRHFRDPLHYFFWKKKLIYGWLALTEKRLRLYGNIGVVNVDLPLDHPAFGQVTVEAVKDSLLEISFDTAAFIPSSSGQITIRYRTDQAREFAEKLVSLQRV